MRSGVRSTRVNHIHKKSLEEKIKYKKKLNEISKVPNGNVTNEFHRFFSRCSTMKNVSPREAVTFLCDTTSDGGILLASVFA